MQFTPNEQYNVTGGMGLFEGAYGVMVDFFFDLSRNQSSTVVVNAWAKFAVPNGNSKLERYPSIYLVQLFLIFFRSAEQASRRQEGHWSDETSPTNSSLRATTPLQRSYRVDVK